jgi:hypothetical protein
MYWRPNPGLGICRGHRVRVVLVPSSGNGDGSLGMGESGAIAGFPVLGSMGHRPSCIQPRRQQSH